MTSARYRLRSEELFVARMAFSVIADICEKSLRFMPRFSGMASMTSSAFFRASVTELAGTINLATEDSSIASPP